MIRHALLLVCIFLFSSGVSADVIYKRVGQKPKNKGQTISPGFSVIHPDSNTPQGSTHSPGPHKAGSDEAMLHELRQKQEEQQKRYDALNTLNPFAQKEGQSASDDSKRSAMDYLTANAPQLADAFKVLNNPLIRRYLGIFSNPVFTDGVSQLTQHPSKTTFLYAELGLIIFMFFFRAWRFSKTSHWLGRLWTNLWTGAFFLVLAAGVIPVILFGSPYITVTKGLFDVFAGKA